MADDADVQATQCSSSMWRNYVFYDRTTSIAALKKKLFCIIMVFCCSCDHGHFPAGPSLRSLSIEATIKDQINIHVPFPNFFKENSRVELRSDWVELLSGWL